jgi:hypothetical protein
MCARVLLLKQAQIRGTEFRTTDDHTEKVIVMVCWHNACWLYLLAANQSKSCQANRYCEGQFNIPGSIYADESPGWLVAFCPVACCLQYLKVLVVMSTCITAVL